MKTFIFYLMLVFFVSDCRPANSPAVMDKPTQPVAGSDSVNINFASRINELKRSLSDDFIVKEHSYFVIASNLSEAETEKILNSTIDKAVECFYNDYFFHQTR